MKSYVSHKLLFGDIKLSDLERRNRKLSAHDCTDHIKTLFSSHNYHETRNINTSQAAMLLVPGHNCATFLVPVHKVHNVLTVFQLWKTTWRLGNLQLVLIVVVVEVLLQEDSFHCYLKNISRTKVSHLLANSFEVSPNLKVHNNNQLYKSLAGDQLWNSGRQDWIFSRIGDQEGAISDPV